MINFQSMSNFILFTTKNKYFKPILYIFAGILSLAIVSITCIFGFIKIYDYFDDGSGVRELEVTADQTQNEDLISKESLPFYIQSGEIDCEYYQTDQKQCFAYLFTEKDTEKILFEYEPCESFTSLCGQNQEFKAGKSINGMQYFSAKIFLDKQYPDFVIFVYDENQKSIDIVGHFVTNVEKFLPLNNSTECSDLTKTSTYTSTCFTSLVGKQELTSEFEDSIEENVKYFKAVGIFL